MIQWLPSWKMEPVQILSVCLYINTFGNDKIHLFPTTSNGLNKGQIGLTGLSWAISWKEIRHNPCLLSGELIVMRETKATTWNKDVCVCVCVCVCVRTWSWSEHWQKPDIGKNLTSAADSISMSTLSWPRYIYPITGIGYFIYEYSNDRPNE